MTPIRPEDLREKVARIADPEMWKVYDYNLKCEADRLGWNTMEGMRQAPGFRAIADKAVAVSLERADAILSLLSSIKEGGTEVLSAVVCLPAASLTSRVPEPGPATPSGVKYSAPHLRPGPWRYDGSCKVWAPSLKGGEAPVCDIRGWGYLTGGGHGALGLPEDEAVNTQDAWGRMIAEAVNARFAALESPHHAPDTREATKRVSADATELKDPAPLPSGEKRS